MLDSSTAVYCLAALAQEHRLAIFRLLVQAGDAGLAAGTIAERMAMPPSSLSFHLAHLMRAEIIQQQRQGRMKIYRTNYSAMNDLVQYLTENCCGGTPCLPAPIRTPNFKEKDAA